MKNGLDSQGYILTETHFGKIKPRHRSILDNVKEELLYNFSGKIHSIYVYGSVATGKAKYKISDLDVLVVFEKKLSISDKKKLKQIQSDLSLQNINFLREVGLEAIDLPYVLDKKHRFGYPCFIQHLCVFFSGENLQEQFSKFKPTVDLAYEFNGDLEKYLKNAQDKLRKTVNKSEHILLAKSIMKKIVRTAFSLVMPRDNSWSTDLEVMSQKFIQYYPDRKKEVLTALRWTKSLPRNRKLLFQFMNDFGGWLVGEFKLQIFDKRN